MAARALKVRPTDEWKDRIQTTMLMKRLDDHSSGKIDLSPTQVKAIEVILDRVAPKLSTVEQTITDSRDKLSEEQVLAELQAVFIAKPYLLDKLIQLRDAARLIQEGDEAISSASSAPLTVG